MQTITKTLDSAVRVTLVEEDAVWKDEFEQYGYDTDMWATYGDGDVWRDNVAAVAVLEDEEYVAKQGGDKPDVSVEEFDNFMNGGDDEQRTES